MGLALSILENLSVDPSDHPYCKTRQYLYFDIGFATGASLERVVIQTVDTIEDPLTENFIDLCEGNLDYRDTEEPLTYCKSTIESIDSDRGILTFGQTLPAIGFSGGFAATVTGKLSCQSVPRISRHEEGAVIFLPSEDGRIAYTSVFCIAVNANTVKEGKVIGKVVEGMSTLHYLLNQFGSKSGIPEKEVIIHSCGRL